MPAPTLLQRLHILDFKYSIFFFILNETNMQCHVPLSYIIRLYIFFGVCKGAPLNSNFILFLVFVKHIICEHFKCLAITVHGIQPGDRQMDRGVLVIGSPFYSLGTNPKKFVKLINQVLHFCYRQSP